MWNKSLGLFDGVFCKQETSYEMRISDWSSDVCSSDLITTNDGQRNNVMTITWTMVMDFSATFAVTTVPWNHSYRALVERRECVIAIPTVDMIDTAVAIGTCSGKNVDKFDRFALTPVNDRNNGAPLILECLAKLE